MLPATLRVDSSKRHCGKWHPWSTTPSSTYRVATVNTSVVQDGLGLSSAINMSLPAYASSLSATRQFIGQIKDIFNLARHLKLTRSLNYGLHWDTNKLRRTRGYSNGNGQQLSKRLYFAPPSPMRQTLF